MSQQDLTDLILKVFQLNGQLLAWGNGISAEYGLTSALWQVLGAVSRGPLTLAGIGRKMGLARQSVRRTAGLLKDRGLVVFMDNPEHKRAHLVRLTSQGQAFLDRINRAYHQAAQDLADRFPGTRVREAAALLQDLLDELGRESGQDPDANP